MTEKITKNMLLGEILAKHPKAAKIIAEKYQIGCMGCPGKQLETLEQGAKMHGIDPDEMTNEINKELEKAD